MADPSPEQVEHTMLGQNQKYAEKQEGADLSKLSKKSRMSEDLVEVYDGSPSKLEDHEQAEFMPEPTENAE